MRFVPPVSPEDEKRLIRSSEGMEEFARWLADGHEPLEFRLLAVFHALSMHVLKLDQRVSYLEGQHHETQKGTENP